MTIEGYKQPSTETGEIIKESQLIVVKVGGSKGVNLDLVCEDLANLSLSGQQAILVHGGSDMVNQLAEKLDHPQKIVTLASSGNITRYTDAKTIEIFEMVYGRINKDIVERLQCLGVNAIGLFGIDGRTLEGRRKPILKVIEGGKKLVLRDNFTGSAEKVNVDLLNLLLSEGYLPIISPLAISRENQVINVDGDRTAALIAGSLEAEKLIILSNIPGFLRNFPEEDSLIPHIPSNEIESHIGSTATRRMAVKLKAAAEATEYGVETVVLADARIKNPITAALNGQGTIID